MPYDPNTGQQIPVNQYSAYSTTNPNTVPAPDPNSIGGALAQGGNLLNQYLTTQTAGNQKLSGITSAQEANAGYFNQQSGLTQPYIQAGAGVGNAIQANTNPYIGAGQQAIGSLQGLQAPLNVNEFLDPSAKFSMQQGLGALNSGAAARGGALSGAALRDLTGYASGLASQNYQNATQNAIANRTQQAGIGQTLYAGGLQGINEQVPIYQGGVQALGYQGSNVQNTQNNATTLAQNFGNAGAQQTQLQGQNYGNAINQAGKALNDYLNKSNFTGQSGSTDQGTPAGAGYGNGTGYLDPGSGGTSTPGDLYTSADGYADGGYVDPNGAAQMSQPQYSPVPGADYAPVSATPMAGSGGYGGGNSGGSGGSGGSAPAASGKGGGTNWGPVIQTGIQMLGQYFMGAADGGFIQGPGTTRSDSIPIRVSTGEYVIPAHVVAQHGKEFFDDLVTKPSFAAAAVQSMNRQMGGR